MSAPDKIWVNADDNTDGCCPVETDLDDVGKFFDASQAVEYTRSDLSQAAVAAALEAAAVKSDDMATEWGKKREAAWRKKNATEEARVFDGMSLAALTVADYIRALITPAQHDALAAHVAAEVAKARAEAYIDGYGAAVSDVEAMRASDGLLRGQSLIVSGLKISLTKMTAQIGAKP